MSINIKGISLPSMLTYITSCFFKRGNSHKNIIFQGSPIKQDGNIKKEEQNNSFIQMVQSERQVRKLIFK